MAYLFPLKDGSLWPLVQLDAYVDAYPSVDVLAELKKAALWLQHNPGRRKTKAGMGRFLTGWLNKAVKDVTKDQPFSREELDRARHVLKNTFGRCPHEPRCATSAACEGRLIRQWRAERKKGAGV